jgi:hypothetical protein
MQGSAWSMEQPIPSSKDRVKQGESSIRCSTTIPFRSANKAKTTQWEHRGQRNTSRVGRNGTRKPKGPARHHLFKHTSHNATSSSRQAELQEQVTHERQGPQENQHGKRNGRYIRREWGYDHGWEQPETAEATRALKTSTRVNHNELITQFPIEYRRTINQNEYSLKILQYNVMKSRDKIIARLLRDPKIQEYDILALQEPWRNPFIPTTHNPISHSFHLYFPKDNREVPARVYFFVNKRIDPNRWTFTEYTPDLSTLEITTRTLTVEEVAKFYIHNIYNPPRSLDHRTSYLPYLRTVLSAY